MGFSIGRTARRSKHSAVNGGSQKKGGGAAHGVWSGAARGREARRGPTCSSSALSSAAMLGGAAPLPVAVRAGLSDGRPPGAHPRGPAALRAPAPPGSRRLGERAAPPRGPRRKCRKKFKIN